MKSRILGALGALFIILLLLPIACGTARDPMVPPTPEELIKEGFLDPDMPRMTVMQVYLKWDANEPMVLVDVRPVELYKSEHIAGARNIPNEPEEDSIAALSALPKDRLIVTYCD
jgi:hypothetical protein